MRPSAVRLARRAVALGAVRGGARGLRRSPSSEGAPTRRPRRPPRRRSSSASRSASPAPRHVRGPLRDAVRAAEGQINAGGGLLGRPVRFDVQGRQERRGQAHRREHRARLRARRRRRRDRPGRQPAGRDHAEDLCGRRKSSRSRRPRPRRISRPSSRRGSLPLPHDARRRLPGRRRHALRAADAAGLGDGGAPLGDGGAPSPARSSRSSTSTTPTATSMADVIAANCPKRGVGQHHHVAARRVSVNLVASYVDVVNEIMRRAPSASRSSPTRRRRPVRAGLKADSPVCGARRQKGFFFIGTDGVFTAGFLSCGRQNRSDPTSPNVAEGVFGTNPDTQPGTKEYNEFKTIYSSYFHSAKPDNRRRRRRSRPTCSTPRPRRARDPAGGHRRPIASRSARRCSQGRDAAGTAVHAGPGRRRASRASDRAGHRLQRRVGRRRHRGERQREERLHRLGGLSRPGPRRSTIGPWAASRSKSCWSKCK